MKLLLLFIVLAVSCRKEASPIPAVINSFTPDRGGADNLVSIIGEKFGEDSLRTTISFNGRPVTKVIQYSDTLIIVVVPPGATTGKISINISGTITVSAKDFVILPGTWVRKKDNALPNYEVRVNGIAFSIGSTGYHGMGYNGGTTLKDFASYDASTESWKRLPDGGLDFQSGIVMVINNKAYIGLGQAFSLTSPFLSKQIWEFDPSSTTWTRKRDFPGAARWAAIGIAVGNKGYIGLGDTGGGKIAHDWWEYDPASDTWTQKKEIPSAEPLWWPAGFSINGRIFVGTGAYYKNKEWFEYIPASDNWVRRADFPGRITFSPTSFVIGNKGYIAGGGDECWAYDASADSWTQQAFIRTILGGSSFVLNNKGYFMPGTGGGGSTNSEYWNKEVWEFTPGN